MQLLHKRRPFLLATLAAAGALVVAYSAEYGFGVKPCELCRYQRAAFCIILLFSLFFMFWPPIQVLKKKALALVMLMCLFAGNMGLAGYQVLVEQKIVEAPKVCRVNKATTLEELRAQLEKSPPVSCDKVGWSLLGISMAGYNGLYNLIFVIYFFLNLCTVRSQIRHERKTI